MHEILRELQDSLSGALRGLTPEQAQLRPATYPSRWSLQQIAQHLTLTYISTSAVFESRIAKGTPTLASPTLQQHLGQIFVTRLGRFPAGRKAPLAVDPVRATEQAYALSGDMLAAAAADQIVHFDALATTAESLFGSRRAISHMVLGPLSVAQWRRFHLVHGRHHIRQIEAIRAHNGL